MQSKDNTVQFKVIFCGQWKPDGYNKYHLEQLPNYAGVMHNYAEYLLDNIWYATKVYLSNINKDS